jgi:hypothetical protein
LFNILETTCAFGRPTGHFSEYTRERIYQGNNRPKKAKIELAALPLPFLKP